MGLNPNGLADAMEAAMARAWLDVNGPTIPMPTSDTKDRRVMFLAVARGLLTYLSVNPTEMVTSITATDPIDGTLTYTSVNVVLKVDLK